MPKLEEVPGLTIVNEVPAGKHGMEVMGAGGDTKYVWDPTKPVEVEAARATYDKLVKAGYRPFRLGGSDGNVGEPMREFDPQAGSLILSTQYKGG